LETKTRPLTSARVDPALAAADEGVKGADDVVAVYFQFEDDVVAVPDGMQA